MHQGLPLQARLRPYVSPGMSQGSSERFRNRRYQRLFGLETFRVLFRGNTKPNRGSHSKSARARRRIRNNNRFIATTITVPVMQNFDSYSNFSLAYARVLLKPRGKYTEGSLLLSSEISEFLKVWVKKASGTIWTISFCPVMQNFSER
ncbi:hypothetical protein K474DRAFT_1676657 [Panus rudis PR-1116 ss-1]|nr:hypothetical protein K474DRAFT_1676657 [Panus rudis PR-1116 ss-1]